MSIFRKIAEKLEAKRKAEQEAHRKQRERSMADFQASILGFVGEGQNWPQVDRQAPSLTPDPEPKRPGRQPLSMPIDGAGGLLSMGRPWAPPIPADAKSLWWEDAHSFAPGAKPARHSVFGLVGQEPPLSMTCVVCELEQTPIRGQDRTCPYCGLRYRLHGTRLFWWREAIQVAEWKP